MWCCALHYIRGWKFLPIAIRWSVGTFARLVGSAFAFSQVNPLRDNHLRTHQILSGHTRIFARACYPRINNVSHVAVARTMYHVATKSVRSSIAPSSELHWGLTLIELLRPYFLGQNRSDGRKLSIPSPSHTPAAWHGAPSMNSLAGLDAPPVYAPSQQNPLPHNSWRTGHTWPGAASPPGSPTRAVRPMEGKIVSLAPSRRRSLLPPSGAWSQGSLRV